MIILCYCTKLDLCFHMWNTNCYFRKDINTTDELKIQVVLYLNPFYVLGMMQSNQYLQDIFNTLVCSLSGLLAAISSLPYPPVP